ncbi:unnamed protein product, partial [Rotaria sp. Silwood2]
KNVHVYFRPTIPSSILNPKITTIAKRSSETGNAGQRIEIYTNHFKINFCTPPNKIILYQFDLGVEVLMSDGSWQRWTGRGGGIGLASGFYQSIVLCERSLTLNINKSFVSFYQNCNLVQFLSCYMGHDIQKNGS